MHSVLLIGGPRDGKRIRVGDLLPVLMVTDPAEKLDLSLSDLDAIGGVSNLGLRFKVTAYRLYHFTGHSKRFPVYAADGLSGDDVTERLLAHYR